MVTLMVVHGVQLPTYGFVRQSQALCINPPAGFYNPRHHFVPRKLAPTYTHPGYSSPTLRHLLQKIPEAGERRIPTRTLCSAELSRM